MSRNLFIIRHGETDFNKLGIIQGRGVNTSINEKGKQQAKSFYEHYKNIPFEKIYTSSLKRTQETVSNFSKADFSIESFPELDEINWGIYEGKFADKSLKEEYFQITQEWKIGNHDIKAKNGESPLELQNRQKIFLDYFFYQTDFKTVLLCIHGRALRVMLCTLLGKSLSCMDDFPHNNLSLYKIKFNGEITGEIELFNDLSHLNGKN